MRGKAKYGRSREKRDRPSGSAGRSTEMASSRADTQASTTCLLSSPHHRLPIHNMSVETATAADWPGRYYHVDQILDKPGPRTDPDFMAGEGVSGA